jgi:3-hydroxyisobutyrate dehydrogenase-like beta-hydroxyacid dehydrogenase
MGHALAVNAMEAGFQIGVYDIATARTEGLVRAGAQPMASPNAAGAWADIVQVVVVDDAQVEEVILGERGILAGTKPGAVIALHSTVKIETVERLGKICTEKGVGFLDVAMSGGEVGAGSGRLCFMVGGDQRSFQLCKPVFEASGTTIVHLGPLGAGMQAKLIQQAVLGATKQAVYEGLFLGLALGLDIALLGKALHGSGAQSRTADDVFERAAQSLGAVEKWGGPAVRSLDLAVELAEQVGLDLAAFKRARSFARSFPPSFPSKRAAIS